MLAPVLLTLAVIAYGLSKIGWMPKANWLEIGFGLAAAAAIMALVLP